MRKNSRPRISVDASAYSRPSDDDIRSKLSDFEYTVTQECGTEPPFRNRYWDHFEKGIYVDVVTGEPLFLSSDKYESSCGWPAFQAPVDESVLNEKTDTSFGMIRTEISSRVGASHLGHVFRDDPESPNGTHYCIDSASLHFIAYDDMDAEGYGKYMKYLE